MKKILVALLLSGSPFLFSVDAPSSDPMFVTPKPSSPRALRSRGPMIVINPATKTFRALPHVESTDEEGEQQVTGVRSIQRAERKRKASDQGERAGSQASSPRLDSPEPLSEDVIKTLNAMFHAGNELLDPLDPLWYSLVFSDDDVSSESKDFRLSPVSLDEETKAVLNNLINSGS